MHEELFTLCDGAYNYNGKLTIVGTLDGIKIPSLPYNVNFGVALKISVDPQESGNHSLSLHFLEPDGDELPTVVAMKFDVLYQEVESHIAVSVDLHGIPIKNVGTYKIIVKIDETELSHHSFFVKLN